MMTADGRSTMLHRRGRAGGVRMRMEAEVEALGRGWAM